MCTARPALNTYFRTPPEAHQIRISRDDAKNFVFYQVTLTLSPKITHSKYSLRSTGLLDETKHVNNRLKNRKALLISFYKFVLLAKKNSMGKLVHIHKHDKSYLLLM